jgi:FMN-dependent NADH-azoreductase
MENESIITTSTEKLILDIIYLLLDKFKKGDIFLIQDKMQISYNFEITTMVKDYVDVNSKINDSGNN